MDQDRAVTEAAIARALLDQWDPLGVHDQPGVHEEYTQYVHDLYNLMARGGSDVQIARRLHEIERDQMGRPELASRDLSALLKTLRAIEKAM
ncbi:MAG: hypothetical protein M3081_19600 [Gemmatimonadota bacterium]|nr:hypothetical protein [Gemmatimonadota bacterium]